MTNEPHKLKPSRFCQLLNSTPLGEVITPGELKRQRISAGWRIGDGKHIDLFRYAAWLMQRRHAPKVNSQHGTRTLVDREESARDAAALASQSMELKGHGQKLSRKKEALIAALLVEPSYDAAAAKVGIARSTLYLWLKLPGFRFALGQARLFIFQASMARIQQGAEEAVAALFDVTRHGQRDSDRVRSAKVILDMAQRSSNSGGTPAAEPLAAKVAAVTPNEVVDILGTNLRQLDQSAVPLNEKSRLTPPLADATLRAIEKDSVVNRIEAIEATLQIRQNEKEEPQ